MKTVRDILGSKGSDVISVSPDATLYEALEVMANRNVGAVLVIDKESKILGIFSERDFVRKIIIKDDKGGTYLEIPLTFGVVGALLAPVLAAVGALAALASNFTLEVVRKESGEDTTGKAEKSEKK